jgi:hypothetical protein
MRSTTKTEGGGMNKMEIWKIPTAIIAYLPLFVSVFLGIVLPAAGYCPPGTCKR